MESEMKKDRKVGLFQAMVYGILKFRIARATKNLKSLIILTDKLKFDRNERMKINRYDKKIDRMTKELNDLNKSIEHKRELVIKALDESLIIELDKKPKDLSNKELVSVLEQIVAQWDNILSAEEDDR